MQVAYQAVLDIRTVGSLTEEHQQDKVEAIKLEGEMGETRRRKRLSSDT